MATIGGHSMTLLDDWNNKPEVEKKKLLECIERKAETCEMIEPMLKAKGYSEKKINWILTRM